MHGLVFMYNENMKKLFENILGSLVFLIMMAVLSVSLWGRLVVDWLDKKSSFFHNFFLIIFPCFIIILIVWLILFAKGIIIAQTLKLKSQQRFPELKQVFGNSWDWSSRTQFWYLARGYDMDYFCDKGASANEKTLHNISLLHIAAGLGDVENCKQLLMYHADPNAKDDNGLTPLDYAKKFNETEVIKLLENYSKK